MRPEWARFAALLTAAVLLVVLAWDVSDIAVIRWRETVGDTDFEYPVLARAIYLAERAVTGSHLRIGVLNAVLMVPFAVAVAAVLRRRGFDASLWMGAPTLLFAGQNVEPITALLLLGALVAWRAGRTGTTGALAGAGAALKVSPAVLVPPLLAAPGEPRRSRLVAGAALVWLALNVPYALRDWDTFAFPFRYASLRDDVRGTVWAALPLSHDAVNVASTILAAVMVVAAAALVARRRVTPEIGVALAMLGFLAANKVWQPHYLLWLLPVLAVVGVAHRPVRALEVANVGYFLSFWLDLPADVATGLAWVTGAARLAAAAWLATVLLQPARSAAARVP